MKMSDVKESFFKKNVGCFTEDDVKSGDYSQQDVLDLLDGYESLLSAFSRYSNNHDRMADEIAELRAKITKKDEMVSDLIEALGVSVDETSELREFVSMVADGDECEESDKLLMAHCFIETAKQLLAKHK